MSNNIKPAWIVCDMDGNSLYNDDKPQEFTTEKAALKRAARWLEESSDSEAWVFKLSHVVSRPPGDPIIEKVT